MRVIYLAAAAVAAASAAAGGILTSSVGASPGDVRALAPRFTALATSPMALPKQRDNKVRLAQTGEPVNTGNPTVAPLKWVGRIVTPAPTKIHPNEVSECTGQFIKPNVVLTAAHCLHDLPAAALDLTNQTFTLQYQAGVGSQTFKTVCGKTNPLWTLPANYSSLSQSDQNAAMFAAYPHDFAMLLVNGNSPTGVMPYALDWKGQVTKAVRVGYAGNILDDEVIQQSGGAVFFADAIPLFPYPDSNIVAQWQGNIDFTNGSSGGAWIANYNTTEGPNNNVLIAVTSFGNSQYPGATFAAYLTAAEFNPLLASVSNGCK
jgi:hypothetical protein